MCSTTLCYSRAIHDESLTSGHAPPTRFLSRGMAEFCCMCHGDSTRTSHDIGEGAMGIFSMGWASPLGI